jgi:hypothetical protein
VTEDGRMELIRERESLDDIVARERLPDRLRIDDAK